VSCYEAGRDGFWLHRFLESIGVHSHVVDSSSIEVNRRRRRRKADRLDMESLLRLLMRFWAGDGRVWSVVRVPSPEATCSVASAGLQALASVSTPCKAIRTRLLDGGMAKVNGKTEAQADGR
jgi:transposase